MPLPALFSSCFRKRNAMEIATVLKRIEMHTNQPYSLSYTSYNWKVTNKKATISTGQNFLFESEPQVKLLFSCFSKFWSLLCLEKLGLKLWMNSDFSLMWNIEDLWNFDCKKNILKENGKGVIIIKNTCSLCALDKFWSDSQFHQAADPCGSCNMEQEGFISALDVLN